MSCQHTEPPIKRRLQSCLPSFGRRVKASFGHDRMHIRHDRVNRVPEMACETKPFFAWQHGGGTSFSSYGQAAVTDDRRERSLWLIARLPFCRSVSRVRCRGADGRQRRWRHDGPAGAARRIRAARPLCARTANTDLSLYAQGRSRICVTAPLMTSLGFCTYPETGHKRPVAIRTGFDLWNGRN
jgi:hypothetical protein